MTDLATLSGRPRIKEYAQGAAQDATSAIADFLAPTVEVARHTGKYRSYDKETRFKIPSSERARGGPATQLAFDRDDANYDCSPHAYDTPLDNIDIDEADGENLLMEAADDSAFMAALAHEKRVIDKAVAGAGGATGGAWSSDSNDPVDEINTAIAQVILAAGGSGKMNIGMIWSNDAIRAFFKNAKTKGYFPGIEALAPTFENAQKLLMSKVEHQISWLASDTAPKGKSSTLAYLMTAKVLVFARNPNPTRRDPSFMKTFRPRGRWMVPGVYESPDKRGQVVKLDWSCDEHVTNSEAGKLFTIS